MMGNERRPRPGGRAARVRRAVHQAVEDLLAEHQGASFTLAEVAARAGVHATSIYRRWGSWQALLLDVAVELLNRDRPTDDTGSLGGDLRAWASAAARSLAGPSGRASLRALAAALPDSADGRRERAGYLQQRREKIQDMLDRAAARGERPPTFYEVTLGVLAPMYFQVLFDDSLPSEEYACWLVDEVLARTVRQDGSLPDPRPSAADLGHPGAAEV